MGNKGRFLEKRISGDGGVGLRFDAPKFFSFWDLGCPKPTHGSESFEIRQIL